MGRLASVLTVVACTLAPAAVAAQTHGGIIGGAGFSRAVSEDESYEEAAGSEFSYSVGIQGAVEFEDYLALKPEVLFSRRTWQHDGGNEETTYRISYIEVPILLRASVPLAGAVAPKIFAGPHASVFLDGEREGEPSGLIFESSGSADLDSEGVNDIQFGVTAGAGVNLNLGDVILTPDLRYVRNFTPVFEDADEDEGLRHESWMLMVGLMY